MGLKFVERSHAYYLDGRRVQGVTTLLNKGLPKPALPYWAAKSVAEYVMDRPEGVEALRAMGRESGIAALKQVPWTERDTAAVRGTTVHDFAERVINGESVEVPDDLAGYVEGYVRWLDAFQVEALHTELPVGNRRWTYGGKFDVIFRFGRGPWAGRVVLGDNKTSKAVYGDTALQTAAYARAEFMAPDPDTELPMPDIDATGVLHVTDSGTTFYPLSPTPEAIDQAFKVFTHIAYLAKQTDWIKDQLGEPMPEPETESAA